MFVSPAVSRMSCPSYLVSFRDRRLVAVQLLFWGMLLPGFVQYSTQHSCAIPISAFSQLVLSTSKTNDPSEIQRMGAQQISSVQMFVSRMKFTWSHTVANELEHDIVLSVFDLLLRYYFHFQTNTLAQKPDTQVRWEMSTGQEDRKLCKWIISNNLYGKKLLVPSKIT